MKDVYITDDMGSVDTSSVKVSKKDNEQVTWHSHAKYDATVSFDGKSPFSQPTFLVHPGESVPSGPPIVPADPMKPYKYNVIGHNGENDPVVIVDN